MQNEIRDNIINKLKTLSNKNVIVEFNGFISASFLINGLNYQIQYDTLTVKNIESDIYLRINLNQIYKCEILNDEVKVYLDNDIMLKILEKYK